MSVRLPLVLQYFGLVTAAALFSLALYHAWELDPRWFVVVVLAIAMVSVAMCFASVFSDFLLMVFFFTLPFASFVKWFWPSNYSRSDLSAIGYGGMLGVGLMDFILCGLYLSWGYRIFVARIAKLPRVEGIDVFVIAAFISYLIATPGSDDPILALQSTEFFGKYALMYFYLSRNLRPEHLPWLLAAFGFTICVEAGLGAVQFMTGRWLGIALDKGAGGSDLDFQYFIPGIESYSRATGTTYDSHALGDLVGMLLPFAFVLFLKPGRWRRLWPLFAIVLALALVTIVMTLSRSSWLATAIALAAGIFVVLVKWRETEIVRGLLIFTLAFLFVLPFASGFIYERFESSPIETLTERYNQYVVALEIWRMYPIFGVGPNNYVSALKQYDFLWLSEVVPVHNVLLWIATETGVVGLVCYVGMLVSGMRRLIKLFVARRDLLGQLALAAFLALVSTFLNGLLSPLFREPSVFTMFWIMMALAVALMNFHRDTTKVSFGKDDHSREMPYA